MPTSPTDRARKPSVRKSKSAPERKAVMPSTIADIPPQVREIMNERRESARRNHVQLLGQVTLIETGHGLLRFPERQGLSIGLMLDSNGVPMDNKLCVMSYWTGLPPLRDLSSTPCPDCKATCMLCAGQGQKICEGVGCGGQGYVVDSQGVQHQCQMCLGKTVMTCSNCKGTGIKSTGIKGGASDWTKGVCPSCQGKCFVGKDVPQDLEKHVNARMGTVIVIGPIVSMVIKTGNPQSPTKLVKVAPDNAGDYLVLLLEPTSTVTYCYLLGGVITIFGQ